MALPDRLGFPPLSGLGERTPDPPEAFAGGLMQKCVIIQRDEKGYGFTVSGDNPVFVASVKQDGAAARAGVQHGDRIVKVNGTLVTQRNHLDVVKLIKSGSYVALTLLGKPSTNTFTATSTSPPSLLSSQEPSGGRRVTAPQPVNPDKDRELWQQKVHMTRAMYETAKEDFERLQKQYVSKPSDKLHGQLIEMARTVKALDKLLKDLTKGDEPVTASSLHSASDQGSVFDWPQTGPGIVTSPDDFHSRHNGQDTEEIIPVDDEVSSEDEQLQDPGPFADIKLLDNRPAHMAVLLNYLISNTDPAPVLFYIITDMYSRIAGSTKELRKWAYEIFSTFIYKSAPLSINVDDSIISQIDNILASSGSRTDNENILRSMFLTSRQSLLSEVSELLTDFRNKKDLGMGNLYGVQKVHDNMDRSSEIKVAEELLMPHLKYFWADDNSRRVIVDRDLAIGWALATFLRSLSGSKSVHSATLDRIQIFMMKDKKVLKLPGSKSNRAKAVKGHQFTPQHLCVTTICNFCGNLLWGVGSQGFQCQNCEMPVHKLCADEISEQCAGKKKRPTTWQGIAVRKPSSSGQHQQQQQPTAAPASVTEQVPPHHSPGQSTDARSPPHQDPSQRLTQPVHKDEDPEIETGNYSVKSIIQQYQKLSSPTKPGQGIQGTLDPKEERARLASSNTDKNSDAESAPAVDINQSQSSSASSLSNRSIESPDISTDNVSDLLRAQHDDPDMDVEAELPPLKQVLSEDILVKLKPKEKKRQEVINELFYTERAHLRNLKVLDLLFNRPMLQEKGIMLDLARALFPNIEEMISYHVSFVKDIRDRSQSTPVVKDVGDLLLKRFDGESGDKFRKGCAEYCRNQAFALDALKKQTRKEPKLQQFLHDAESNTMCRRLQLKDLVPSQMQRLTKYPLLIDNLLKYTIPNGEEYRKLERALDRCKQILAYVNQAVKECENYHKLKDIQKKLDRRSLEVTTDTAMNELKNIDLTQHKLIFDGPLTWKLRQHRTVDLHVLLFDDMLVLLQKQDDRYLLKCQNTNVQPARDDKYTHFPILRLQNLLARTLATEKRSFFVVNISESRAQMYEFTAASSEQRIKWCKLINDKADEWKKRTAHLSSALQEEQARKDRNRLSGLQHGSPTNADQVTPPNQEDLYAVTNQLSRHLDIGEGPHIPPEDSSISDAVSPESPSVDSPQAAVCHKVRLEGEAVVLSSQQIQPPPQLMQQSSLSAPISMDQLKYMASEMNVMLAKLAGAINSGNEEKQRLRQELQEAQVKLESLKQRQKQISESTSGRSSPRVPAMSDIPFLSDASGAVPSTLADAAVGEEEGAADAASLQGLDSSDIYNTTTQAGLPLSLLQLQQEKEEIMLKEKYKLDDDDGETAVSQVSGDLLMAGSSVLDEGEESVLHGVQEVAVSQLDESVELLYNCKLVTATATETGANESEMTRGGSVSGQVEDDDDDANEVSVADLPLPDVISIREEDLVAPRLLRDAGHDDSELDSDDCDTLTSKTNYQDVTSLASTDQDSSVELADVEGLG